MVPQTYEVVKVNRRTIVKVRGKEIGEIRRQKGEYVGRVGDREFRSYMKPKVIFDMIQFYEGWEV